MKLTYNKHEKLKSKKVIDQLFLEGNTVMAHPLRLVYLKNDTGLKTGVSASKKHFKRAVDRIRIKRLMREAYRLNKSMLINTNNANFTFMILYIGKETPNYTLVNDKMKALFTKFIDQNS